MGNNLKGRIGLVLKGMAMGAADIVPGVSGGTIALITGIYEEFVNALKSFSSAIGVLKNQGFKACWQHINGNFLLTLFSGIIFSLLGLVQFIKYALVHQPILLWSFFFGLIVASCFFVGKMIKKWSAWPIFALIIGTVATFFITGVSPTETTTSLWFVFVAGMIAICAMILPGISGSFILVLLGKYKFIISALSDFNFTVIITFTAGCIVGLLSFSHLLSYMLKKYHDITMALLTGFMIGSLNKIWPWKITTQWGIDRHGEQIPLMQNNILPQDFKGDAELMPAIALAIFGAVLIILIELIANRKSANSSS